MSRAARIGAALLGLLCVAPAALADKKDESAESFTTVGEVTGVIKSVKASEGSGSVTLRVTSIGVSIRGRLNQKGQDLSFDFTPDYKVRTMQLPPVTDEKGKVVKRKADELKKLKGPGKEPGYMADPADLRPNQIVQLTLVRIKGAKADAPAFASKVVILVDAPAGANSAPGGKKPEKK